jgi:HAD superfamily hydrolase (TIGR01450 family)
MAALFLQSGTALKERLRQIRHVALDMDGTIYRGHTLLEHTVPFLKLLKELGIGHTFLTNNSSRSSLDYLAHLKQMGIPASLDEIRTSTQATVEHLQRNLPALRRLFLLGTQSLGEEFVAEGFTLADNDPADEPDAVVVGFDTALVFSRLCRAAFWIKAGKPFIATHPDLICPTDEPTVLVDCGSICAALERATSRAPSAVLGKPDPAMLSGILRRHGLEPEQLAMVGDRLYTDMAMARKTGAVAILVLTGETTAAEVAAATPQPDLVVRDLGELAEQFRKSFGQS